MFFRPGGDQPARGGEKLATREEIMMVLDNIEHFLIKLVLIKQ